MEFNWLESRTGGQGVRQSTWSRDVSDKARLLARLGYAKAHVVKRCEQDLEWSFGAVKQWPVKSAALKKLVAEAFRSEGIS